MNQPLIKPQTLKGFRDYLPDQMMARERLIETARQVFRSFGFSPIDTPALEYSRILLGKGGDESDKQLFRFTDQGQRDVAMRFDLTVPLARFAAMHFDRIGVPFKRYHIGTVWRAEKPQKGRYREFIQCDFDTIGTSSNTADIETLLVIHDLMQAIGFSKFTICVNHRLILNGILEELGLSDKSAIVLRSLDKLDKIGKQGVQKELTAVVGLTDEDASRILELVQRPVEETNEQSLDFLERALANSETGRLGVDRLRESLNACRTAGIDSDRIVFRPQIARGLDYYTGTIYETFLDDLPGIGSVCSGGRYDNLAELFTKQQLPGVGASLGLDRLLAAMQELGMIAEACTPAPVLITLLDADRLGDYLRIGRALRRSGINAEVFPENRPLGKQLKYANRKGFRIALIAGADEFSQQVWQVKDLQTGERENIAEADLAGHIQRLLRATV